MERKKKEKKSKEKKERKSKALLSSSSTSESKKRGRRPKGSKDNFTLHRLTVNPGEDLIKVMEKFNCHYKHRNVCIISATGTASKFEVHSSPNPLQFEGQFLLLSLSVRRTLQEIIAGTFKRTISGESPTANQNINLASEDASVVLENLFANPNISSASEYVVADKNDQQLGTDANNVDIDEYGDIIN